jgi:PilZ domain
MSRPKKGPERRKKNRVALTRGVLARFGTLGVIMIDTSESGARIEHFTRLELAKKARFRFDWRDSEIQVEAVVVVCKVHRFVHGEQGATVFQSGLQFVEFVDNAQETLKELVSTSIARSLAEQVANARGIGPVTERNMPVFRSGIVTAAGLEPKSVEQAERLFPKSEIVVDRGYIRCTLVSNNRWDKKWSRTPDQPVDGFTVLATEPADHIDQLCETYIRAGEEERKLIRLLASVSVEKNPEMPEPR